MKKKKELIAIQFGESFLKLLSAQVTDSGWKIKDCALEELKDLTDERIIEVIKDYVQKKAHKGLEIIVLVPRAMVTVKYLDLPTSDSKELQHMIGIQALRQIPYSADEIVYDYGLLHTDQSGYTNALIAIVKKEVVYRYLDLLEKAGVQPKSVELDSLAMVEAVIYCNNVQKDPDKCIDMEGIVAIIDLDNSSSNIAVIEKGRSLFTRGISIGTEQLDSVTNVTLRFEWQDEIHRSLLVFQRDYDKKVENVIVLGYCKDSILLLLRQKLGIPVVSWKIKDFINELPEKESFQRVGEGFVSVTSLLGAIKEGINTTLNLIPDTVKTSWMMRQKKRAYMLTGVLLLGICVVAGLTFNKKIHERKIYLASIQKRLEETSPLAKELEVKKERLALIKEQLSIEGSCLDILRELYTIIPQKTALTVFIYDDDLGVTIKGTSPTMSEVFALIPKLEESPYFENVTSRYATQRRIKGQELTDFHIDCSTGKSAKNIKEEE